MAKVIVGISGNVKVLPAMSGMVYDAVGRDLSQAVTHAGGLPIVIPMGTPDLAKNYVAMIDKLILSGGQNVHPKFYGEEKSIDSDDYSLERDEFELALIQEALKQGKPIFAVCRGMQLLNVALGGSLHQDIENHWQEDLTGTSHDLQIRPGSRVSRLFQESRQVNSLHRQSIKTLGEGLVVTAKDPRDETIEAYEGDSLLGLQWHPEFLMENSQANRRLFEYLVQEF
ncbi:gamma-glutamyl-gamma-aminobutyrate hydrolase family protein [Streptococcus sp. 20-1249]|uniref:gamma-glutamyl-gamma-aminobutyrate hydrolase family protein n=1 Tax=Streptococcus hepaticus TaxID=3349163 RepID=UPI0037496004